MYKKTVRGLIMSQEKVNQYKEQKKNRKEIIKKEKRKALISKVCVAAVLLVVAGWLVYSAVVTVQNAEGPAVTVNTSALTEYVNNLSE